MVHTLENVIWYNKPAKEWLQAFPIGNGRLGAMVYGDPENEHLQLNEDSMWPGKMDQGDSRGNVKDLQRIRTFFR
jgi:alpha-L-fucosidase 2